MSLNIKTEEGLQKIAGSTLILDASCADIRTGTFTLTTNTHDGLDSKTINFDSPFPSDDDYVITFNKINGDAVHSIVCSGKSAVGFSIIGSQMNYVNGTSTYEYSCARLIVLDGYTNVKRKVENPDIEPIEHSTNFVTSNGIYNALKNVKSIQYDEIPTPSTNWENKIIEYVGETTENYINGYFYKCIDEEGTFTWKNIPVQDGSTASEIQFDIMPMADENEYGHIVEYVGPTNSVYTNGYFYECILDGNVYKWIPKQIQENEDIPHISGTKNEINAKIANDEIPDGAYVAITDDMDEDSTDVVDVIENNNMHPVTSNAVYKNWKKEYGTAITITKGTGDVMYTTVISDSMTIKDGNNVNHNIGNGGSHAFSVAWTTEGYLLFIIDVTVVCAIKGGTILTNASN